MYECRITCKWCKYHDFDKNKVGYSPCKMIDHDLIQLRPKAFGGYSKAFDNNDICYFYEPAEFIKNPSFTNIEEYTKWLSEEWFVNTKSQKRQGFDKIKHFQYVTLRIPSEDIELEIHLYDWLMNTWREGNKIKYKKLSKLIKNKKGKYYKKEVLDTPDVKSFGIYEFKGDMKL